MSDLKSRLSLFKVKAKSQRKADLIKAIEDGLINDLRGALDDFRGQWGAGDLEWLSRYDGLRAFRITKLGAWVLGMTDQYEKTLPESSLQLRVSPDKTIRVVSGNMQSSDRMLLEATRCYVFVF